MTLVSQLAALVGTGVVYGTDVFCALAQSRIVGKIVNTGPGPVARKAGNRERT